MNTEASILRYSVITFSKTCQCNRLTLNSVEHVYTIFRHVLSSNEIYVSREHYSKINLNIQVENEKNLR